MCAFCIQRLKSFIFSLLAEREDEVFFMKRERERERVCVCAFCIQRLKSFIFSLLGEREDEVFFMKRESEREREREFVCVLFVYND